MLSLQLCTSALPGLLAGHACPLGFPCDQDTSVSSPRLAAEEVSSLPASKSPWLRCWHTCDPVLSLASFWFACAHLFPSFVGKTFCRFFFFPGATESSSLGLGRLGLTAHGPSLPSSVLFRHALFIEFSNVVAVCMIARFSFPLLISLCVCKCVNPRLHILRALRLSAGFFFFFFLFLKYLFILGCAGSSLQCTGFLELQRAGGYSLVTVLHWTSHCGGFSCCGASCSRCRRARYLSCTCLVALQHMGSSQTGDGTLVP